MLGIKIQCKFENGLLTVKNLSNIILNDCLINLKNIFNHNVVFQIATLQPNIEQIFKVTSNNFDLYWMDDVVYLNVYQNHKLIYQKNINDKSKCYVIYSNENFEALTEQLIIGLDTYSTSDVVHYSINYECKLNYPNLKNISYYVDGDIKDGQYMQFMKPKLFLDLLNRGYKNAVFLDADIQVRPNIDDMFKFLPELDAGPLLQKNSWDYTLVEGQYIPGPLLQEYMKLPLQKFPQGVTNVMAFNTNHKSLFEEWESICFSSGIDEIRKKEFLHDELILNCLLWKLGIPPKEHNLFVNTVNLNCVHFFYTHYVGNTESVNMNDYGYGWGHQSFIPYDKNIIKGFHSIKDSNVASSVNEYVFMNDYLRGNYVR